MQPGEMPVNPRAKQHLNLRHGRKWGAKAKIPQDLKQAIVDAASAYGADGYGEGGLTGYCYHLASKHPKAFSSLLGKLLPYQINTMRSAVQQINIVSVPCDRYLGPEDVRKLRPELPVVEHETAQCEVELAWPLRNSGVLKAAVWTARIDPRREINQVDLV
jgi:hypothetical protein